MQVYISGPMSGIDRWNEPVFREFARRLAALGHRAVVPHDVAPTDGEYPDQLLAAIGALRGCEAIMFTPCWQESPGANAERRFAAACRIPQARFAASGTGLDLDDLSPVPVL